MNRYMIKHTLNEKNKDKKLISKATSSDFIDGKDSALTAYKAYTTPEKVGVRSEANTVELIEFPCVDGKHGIGKFVSRKFVKQDELIKTVKKKK